MTEQKERSVKVFVTQYNPKLRFTEAAAWGEVVFLTDMEYVPMPCPPSTNKRIRAQIEKNMADYVPGHDYLLMTGSAIPNFVAGMLAGKLKGPHKILKWSNRIRNYEFFMVD